MSEELFAHLFGALAVIINFIGYRQNDVNRYRFVSAIGLIFLGLHFLLIDAMAAGVACLLSSLRNFIAMKTQHVSVVVIFVGLNLAFFAYEWFVLDHGALIIVAYTSSIIFTVGSVVLDSATRIRQWFIVAESLGLIYAMAVGSVFGVIFNISNLISIVTKLRKEKRLRVPEAS